MTLQGFSLPLSPLGEANLVPAPPWYYAGDVLVVDYMASPDATAALLPPGVDPDPDENGRVAAFFVDWQYCTERGEELTDPSRSQYREFIVLVSAHFRGSPVVVCPYIYVSSDIALARGWIQGWPKKLGQVDITRAMPLAAPASPRQEAGGRFGGTLSVHGRRLAEAAVTLERPAEDPVTLGRRPTINMRHFPRLAAGQRDKPSVHELVRSVMSDILATEVWEGTADLNLYQAPGEELASLAPRTLNRGYRYSTALRVDDIETLADLTQ